MNTATEPAKELPFKITPLVDVQNRIHLEYKRVHEAEQDRCQLTFNRDIESKLKTVTKLTDVADVMVPHDLDRSRLMSLIEKYRLTGWTMQLIKLYDGTMCLRFIPFMDHQHETFRPS